MVDGVAIRLSLRTEDGWSVEYTTDSVSLDLLDRAVRSGYVVRWRSSFDPAVTLSSRLVDYEWSAVRTDRDSLGLVFKFV